MTKSLKMMAARLQIVGEKQMRTVRPVFQHR
jgi:hypothetical protein